MHTYSYIYTSNTTYVHICMHVAHMMYSSQLCATRHGKLCVPWRTWTKCCSVLQYVVVCCSVLQRCTTWFVQCAMTHIRHTHILQPHCSTLQHTAAHCKTLQNTATHCSTLQHTAAHCNTLQHTATLPRLMLQEYGTIWIVLFNTFILQHTTTHCNTLQHTANNCKTRHHIATYCNTL